MCVTKRSSRRNLNSQSWRILHRKHSRRLALPPPRCGKESDFDGLLFCEKGGGRRSCTHRATHKPGFIGSPAAKFGNLFCLQSFAPAKGESGGRRAKKGSFKSFSREGAIKKVGQRKEERGGGATEAAAAKLVIWRGGERFAAVRTPTAATYAQRQCVSHCRFRIHPSAMRNPRRRRGANFCCRGRR